MNETEDTNAGASPAYINEPSASLKRSSHPECENLAGELDETSRLRELQAHVRDQNDLERDIGLQADKMLLEQADERDIKRLGRTTDEKRKLQGQVLKLRQRLSQPVGASARLRIRAEIEKTASRISDLEADEGEIQQRIDERHQEREDPARATSTGRLPNESRRDYLIRTGKITPFSKMGMGPKEGVLANLHDALIDAEDERDEAETLEELSGRATSHRHLRLPGLPFDGLGKRDFVEVPSLERAAKRRKLQSRATEGPIDTNNSDAISERLIDAATGDDEDADSWVDTESTESLSTDEDEYESERIAKKQTKKRKTSTVGEKAEDFRGVDDGNEELYQSRFQSWVHRRAAARSSAQKGNMEIIEEIPEGGDHASTTDEWSLPHPTVPDTVYDEGYRLPGDIYPYLFDYQKTGVQWLWELYRQKVGGIVGDEMGLGKTIQVISFLAGLHYSKKLTKPIIVVAPATVMKQWVNEFHRWWPPFRVSILHSSGSGMINIGNENRQEALLASQMWNPQRLHHPSKGQTAASKIVKRVMEEGHVLVTTYSGLQTYAPLLIPVDWGCSILDEGHKIRNPNTAITIYCKELRTPHRLILSGTPMQNNLTELWSLFDFVFPMRLGTLVNFRNQFEFPIRQGGYANATNLQVQTAARCAETLKEAISPYLLQRFKADVAADLPMKSEQVLFCKLTKVQRTAYEAFLGSEEMRSVLNGRRQVLYGIDILRKICNHPDLQDHKLLSTKVGYGYGSALKSGKMQVVKALLELWKDTYHKTLLFAQHRMMLDILEKFIRSLPGFKYRRMDGNTPIQNRQGLVDDFNTNPDLHVFLLTTKVGGLGVNLTGADRVIIYDPDWNPSTDVQARERAWRLGQKRDVTIYRLMTAGTIEEKIYHRQIFKQFLTNKILKDPKQRQTFQLSNLHDLFTLGNDGPTETSTLFKDVEVTYESMSQGVTSKMAPALRKAPNSQEEKNISKVVGVASVEEYQGQQDPSSDKTMTPGAPNSEARLMERIFARSGVHSALEHEQIVNGKRVVKADPKIIEAEARKVASEAAAALRASEQAARSIPIGTPTWTGQVGIAGKPEDLISSSTSRSSFFGGARSTARRARTGPSSTSLLANLGNRTAAGPFRGGGSGSSSDASQGTPYGVDFITMIRDYIVSHGGSVYTQMLIDHFDRFCTTPQRSAEFKEMLKTIAVLEKGSRNGRGKWSLKPEYVKRK